MANTVLGTKEAATLVMALIRTGGLKNPAEMPSMIGKTAAALREAGEHGALVLELVQATVDAGGSDGDLPALIRETIGQITGVVEAAAAFNEAVDSSAKGRRTTKAQAEPPPPPPAPPTRTKVAAARKQAPSPAPAPKAKAAATKKTAHAAAKPKRAAAIQGRKPAPASGNQAALPLTEATPARAAGPSNLPENAFVVDGLPPIIPPHGRVLRDTSHPAVPIRESITKEGIVCLEDGAKKKMLKRYIRQAWGMSPEQYRARWGLPDQYPMVAPNYSKMKSMYAKATGLGTYVREEATAKA